VLQAVDPLHVIETVMRYFYSLRASGATKCGTDSNSRTLLFVVYIGAVGVAAGVLLVAIEAAPGFEPASPRRHRTERDARHRPISPAWNKGFSADTHAFWLPAVASV
jgi:hypothetical protein